jgi:hypothetical protein
MESNQPKRLLAAGVMVALDSVTAEVAQAFARSGVRSILLKGSSVIDWLYGQAPGRYSVDVDLLVAPGQLADVEAVLSGLGFRPREPSREERHAFTWARDGGLDVDLHRALVGIGVSSEEAWEILCEQTEVLELPAGRVEVLAPAARALHLALHAAQHGREVAQPLADLERAVEVLPFELWAEAAALAERLDATPAFAAGLRLVPGGREIAERLHLSTWVPPAVALRQQTAPDMTLVLNRALETPGLRRKTSLLLRRAFPPPSEMRARSPLARRGTPGLAGSYIARAGWLVLRIGPAVVHVRAARRGAADGSSKGT